MAITNSDKIIAISEATKKDILKFFPRVPENKIRVIYHGFSPDVYAKDATRSAKPKSKESLELQENIFCISALSSRARIWRS